MTRLSKTTAISALMLACAGWTHATTQPTNEAATRDSVRQEAQAAAQEEEAAQPTEAEEPEKAAEPAKPEGQ